MMADVYSNSSHGLIWLGTTGSHAKALRMKSAIEAVHEDARKETENFESLANTVTDTVEDIYYADGGLAFVPDYWALQHFYGNAWFRRLWVVQEAALCGYCTCYLGPIEMPLSLVLRAACWLSYKRRYLKYDTE